MVATVMLCNPRAATWQHIPRGIQDIQIQQAETMCHSWLKIQQTWKAVEHDMQDFGNLMLHGAAW